MGIVDEKWRAGECRIEDGIFFPTDEVRLFSGNVKNGYVAEPIMTLASLVETAPDAWAVIGEYSRCRLEINGLSIVAGSGSWEGEGFIAVEAVDKSLLWLMHFNDSEAFQELKLDGEQIIAISSEYPDYYEWVIPVNEPHRLRVAHVTS